MEKAHDEFWGYIIALFESRFDSSFVEKPASRQQWPKTDWLTQTSTHLHRPGLNRLTFTTGSFDIQSQHVTFIQHCGQIQHHIMMDSGAHRKYTCNEKCLSSLKKIYVSHLWTDVQAIQTARHISWKKNQMWFYLHIKSFPKVRQPYSCHKLAPLLMQNSCSNGKVCY